MLYVNGQYKTKQNRVQKRHTVATTNRKTSRTIVHIIYTAYYNSRYSFIHIANVISHIICRLMLNLRFVFFASERRVIELSYKRKGNNAKLWAHIKSQVLQQSGRHRNHHSYQMPLQ